jgi:hypothetical protein
MSAPKGTAKVPRSAGRINPDSITKHHAGSNTRQPKPPRQTRAETAHAKPKPKRIHHACACFRDDNTPHTQFTITHSSSTATRIFQLFASYVCDTISDGGVYTILIAAPGSGRPTDIRYSEEAEAAAAAGSAPNWLRCGRFEYIFGQKAHVLFFTRRSGRGAGSRKPTAVLQL